jgi:hypothetical protein
MLGGDKFEKVTVTYHRHTLDRLYLPCRQGRLESHVIILQYPKAERADRILRRQLPSIRKRDCNARFGVLDHRDGRVEQDLRRLEKLGCLCLNKVLEPALVNREEIVGGEAPFIDVIRKIVSLYNNSSTKTGGKKLMLAQPEGLDRNNKEVQTQDEAIKDDCSGLCAYSQSNW